MSIRLLGISAILVVTFASSFARPEAPQDPPVKELYQDFRNKRPLLDPLRLSGPDVDEEVKPEDEGLRITLQAKRKEHWSVEVIPDFPLSGDFEVTGTYELLSARRPIKGYGVGVHLNVADTEERIKFAKVTRVFMPQEGSVYLTQYWLSMKDYQVHTKKAKAMAGQLRLTRTGSSLRYLVSDGIGEKFREIWYQPDFGAEDLNHFRYGVSDSGEPGNPVDARLVDLRIRMGGIQSDKAFDPTPLTNPAPPPTDPNSDPDRPKSRLRPVFILGLAVILTLVIILGVWLSLRRRGAPSPATLTRVHNELVNPESASSSVAFPCPDCGKKLRVRVALAGKKVKCAECGKPVLVPGA